MSFLEIKHQDRALGLLGRALSSNRLPHAYIFHGPDGVGKESCAVWLAGVLLCPHLIDGGSVQRACGRCDDCHTIGADTHPDLHRVHRQLIKYHDDPVVRRRKGIDLGVDVIRQFVIDQVAHKPVRGRAKVFIVRQADRITPQAQNALLKTLEEPPATTFIVLLVSSLDRLLPTTHSRCQLIPFGALPVEFIVGKLAEQLPELSADQAGLLARLADGSLGLALQYARDGLPEFNRRMIDALSALPGRTVAEVTQRWHADAKELGAKFKQADPDISDTEAERRGFKTLLSLAALWYRDVLHVNYGATGSIANQDQASRLAQLAQTIGPGQAVAAIQHLADSQGHIDSNVNIKLSLDHTVIRLARLVG